MTKPVRNADREWFYGMGDEVNFTAVQSFLIAKEPDLIKISPAENPSVQSFGGEAQVDKQESFNQSYPLCSKTLRWSSEGFCVYCGNKLPS